MVEVDEDNDEDQIGVAHGGDLDDDKVPGEDDEPDMGGYGDEEEELVPIKPKHGGLFGADINSVKY